MMGNEKLNRAEIEGMDGPRFASQQEANQTVVEVQATMRKGIINKTYLGDGAYAALNAMGDIVLTTEDGISTTNTIVLGPTEFALLEHYAKRNWQ